MTRRDENTPIILASSSPRRIELLRALGIEFNVVPSDIEESFDVNVPIDELVKRNALAKAKEVAERFDRGLIIGADTVVICDGEIFGKPLDISDARQILKRLAGNTHQVYTGVAVIRAEDFLVKTAHAVTDVTFRPLSEANIDRYFEMVDPLDKAGAYAIQGAGGIIIEKLAGCYYNVVGLPLNVLDGLLSHFGTELL
jgi:septum formation protein